MHKKDSGCMAVGVDPDQAAPFRSSLIWVYTVYSCMIDQIVIVNGKDGKDLEQTTKMHRLVLIVLNMILFQPKYTYIFFPISL